LEGYAENPANKQTLDRLIGQETAGENEMTRALTSFMRIAFGITEEEV
jgi:hypothetical protein